MLMALPCNWIFTTLFSRNSLTYAYINSFTCSSPVWSCTWSQDNLKHFFIGTQSGEVLLFDIRDTREHVASLLPQAHNPKSIVSLRYVPRFISSSPGYVNGSQMWNAIFEARMDLYLKAWECLEKSDLNILCIHRNESGLIHPQLPLQHHHHCHNHHEAKTSIVFIFCPPCRPGGLLVGQLDRSLFLEQNNNDNTFVTHFLSNDSLCPPCTH